MTRADRSSTQKVQAHISKGTASRHGSDSTVDSQRCRLSTVGSKRHCSVLERSGMLHQEHAAPTSVLSAGTDPPHACMSCMHTQTSICRVQLSFCSSPREASTTVSTALRPPAGQLIALISRSHSMPLRSRPPVCPVQHPELHLAHSMEPRQQPPGPTSPD
jgi:hypothetical protein